MTQGSRGRMWPGSSPRRPEGEGRGAHLIHPLILAALPQAEDLIHVQRGLRPRPGTERPSRRGRGRRGVRSDRRGGGAGAVRP